MQVHASELRFTINETQLRREIMGSLEMSEWKVVRPTVKLATELRFKKASAEANFDLFRKLYADDTTFNLTVITLSNKKYEFVNAKVQPKAEYLSGVSEEYLFYYCINFMARDFVVLLS